MSFIFPFKLMRKRG